MAVAIAPAAVEEEVKVKRGSLLKEPHTYHAPDIAKATRVALSGITHSDKFQLSDEVLSAAEKRDMEAFALLVEVCGRAPVHKYGAERREMVKLESVFTEMIQFAQQNQDKIHAWAKGAGSPAQQAFGILSTNSQLKALPIELYRQLRAEM